MCETLPGSIESNSTSSNVAPVGLLLLSILKGYLALLVCSVNALSIASKLFPLLSGMKRADTSTVIKHNMPKK
jgi:hypothetical protein